MRAERFELWEFIMMYRANHPNSLPIPGHRGSANLETRAFEAQSLQRPKQKLPSEPIVTNLESYSESSQDITEGTKTGN
jgi:hypothetical protein